jgi:hypothetical protein
MAVGRLRRAGLISQRRDGSWLLRGPRPQADGQKGWDGVAMPVLSDMVAPGLGVRHSRDTVAAARSRAVATRELKERLAEQRETLRVAAKRHEEMLERMRQETDRLMAAGTSFRGRRDAR